MGEPPQCAGERLFDLSPLSGPALAGNVNDPCHDACLQKFVTPLNEQGLNTGGRRCRLKTSNSVSEGEKPVNQSSLHRFNISIATRVRSTQLNATRPKSDPKRHGSASSFSLLVSRASRHLVDVVVA